MNGKKILSVKEVRQLPKEMSFNVIGVVSRLGRRKDRNGNPYWDITLSDGSGELEGKVWSNAAWWNLSGGERLPIDPMNSPLNFEGSTAGLQGKVAEFRDQLQYNFSDIFYLDQTKYPPHGFVRRSPLSDEKMEQTFISLVAGTHEPIRGFLERVFFDHGLWKKFKVWPAAVSLHHAYVGGLLEHSLSVANSAKDIARHYADDLGMPVNLDLVVAGALLHDLGKLETYSLSPIPQMTTPGNVVEHILLGYHRFMKLAEEEGLEEGLTLSLGHIIASHHGRREYGSPVLPATPEALIVAAADDLDFKLFYWRSQIEALEPRHEVTDFLPLLERRFWRGPNPAQDEDAQAPASTPTGADEH